jgi:hypothetical protein
VISLVRNILIFNIAPFLVSLFVIKNEKIKMSIFLGWIIVLVSIVIGILAFELSKKKNNKTFLKIYFGGMIFRLILLLFLIFAFLKYIGINPVSFLFSLFIFYIINQIIELRYILNSNKKL